MGYDIHVNNKEYERVFNQLFVEYYKPLCGFAHFFVNDVEVAREIIQDIFLRFWEKAPGNDNQIALKSYLYTSARNACIDYLNRNRLHQEYRSKILLEDVNTYDDHFGQLVAKELSKKIEEAVLMLPPQCQKVFRLSRFEQLKNREIAEQLGISIKAVEGQMSKALHFLKNQLSDYYILLPLLHLPGFLTL